MKKNNINVLSVLNSRNITEETIDGEVHIVIKGVVPLVDDVVMNGGLYPAAEIDKSYATLDGNAMPLGHPVIDGKYVSASDVRAVNKHHIGAWARNARKENGKVLVDMCINKRFAESTDGGKRLLERLDDLTNNAEVKPIHVSTGLILNKKDDSGTSKGKKYNWVATNMFFDHIAILLDQPGAATPDDGVGIFVNSDGANLDVENVDLGTAADCRKEGWLNKVKFYLSANSDLAFEEISRALYELVNKQSGGNYKAWIESVYPKYFIYEYDGKKYKQPYFIGDDNQIELTGERVEVVRRVGYEEVKTNGEQNSMKEKIIAALNAAGVKSDGLNDDELLTAYNELQAKSKDEKKPKDGKPEDKPKDDELEEKIKKAVNAALAPINAKLEANQAEDLAKKRAAVKSHFALDDAAVNALEGEALNGLYAKTINPNGINGAMGALNADDDLLNMEAPE